MKLTVKTLKGSKFIIACEPSQTVLEVKTIIESTNSELPASNMKLIHSGKVLKVDSTIESCGIKQNDFLVVMVTKSKKSTAKSPAPTSAPAAPIEAKNDPVPAFSSETKTSPNEDNQASESATSSPPSDAVSSVPTPATNLEASASLAPELPVEIVNSLTGMGFPEAEVRHCLRAANGNPDVAVEFLTNGIPPGMQPGEQDSASNLPSTSIGNGGTLAGLRNHPQFNDLRRLVQSNPAMLQRVLTQIGQQQPELLTEINANQELFLQMMNEPITEMGAPSSGSSSNSGSGSQSSASSGTETEMQGIPQGMMEGMANPAQMAQLIQNMSPGELNQMANMMGLSSEQLRSTAQMLGQIPPEQLQQYMIQAVQGSGSGNLGGMMGGASGGPQVLRLTEEEMAAVNRLADMGFDRTEAAQAYLACDKNEALAANLLMDSMGDGFEGGPGEGGNTNDNDGDDMYD